NKWSYFIRFSRERNCLIKIFINAKTKKMQQFPIGLPLIIIVIIILYILASSIRILREYERGVIFRLGRVLDGGVKGPGLILLIPIIDKMVKVSLRTVVMDVPPQDVITQDNVS